MCTKGSMLTKPAFQNAINKYLPGMPGMPVFLCWNHFFSRTEKWVLEQGGKTCDVRFYNDSLRQVLSQPTKILADSQIAKSKIGYTTSNGQDIPAWDA